MRTHPCTWRIRNSFSMDTISLKNLFCGRNRTLMVTIEDLDMSSEMLLTSTLRKEKLTTSSSCYEVD